MCWVFQRIRTNNPESKSDKLAIDVKKDLDASIINEFPWLILKQVGADKFKDWTAFAFLKSLRDAVAHGDARKIIPINKDEELIGFKFSCEKSRKPIGEIELNFDDMVRLGVALSDIYCKKMQE